MIHDLFKLCVLMGHVSSLTVTIKLMKNHLTLVKEAS
jgi:hypothetical protein